MSGFPFPTASTRFRITYMVDGQIIVCEKNADGPNHALERAQRHVIRTLAEADAGEPSEIELVAFEVIETNTVPS